MGYFRAAGLARMRRTEVRPMCRLGNSDFRLWGGIHVPAQITAQPAEFVHAGHNPPLLRDASGSIAQLEIGGLPCGTFPDATYEVGHIAAGPGDLLLIYSDGVVEAVDAAGDEYGLDRLCALARKATGNSASVQRRLLASIEAFAGRTPQHDDITSMVVQITG